MPKLLRRRTVVERIDPEEDFSDVDGDLRSEFELVGDDPTRKYVWAHNSQDDIGYFKGYVVPYRLERATEDGVRPKMGGAELEKDDVITRKDHVLMSCDKALWEKRQRYERVVQAKRNAELSQARQKPVEVGKHRHEWAAVNGR